MSQWVDDIIDTKQSCDQQPGSFTQDPGKSGYFTHDPGVWKTWIFYVKKLDLATHHSLGSLCLYNN